LFLELLDRPVELFACISFKHRGKFVVAKLPDLLLLVGVLQFGDRLTHLVIQGHVSDLDSPGPVLGVSESRVV
jgi:hypothetical protein